MKKRKMFSRITALVLSAVMLLSLSAVSVFANGAAQTVTLAEMNKLSLDGLRNNPKVYLSTIAYKSAKGSVMYPLGESTALYWRLNQTLAQLSEGGTLKVRFYSEDVGAKFALMFRNEANGGNYGGSASVITINQSGWQEISIASTVDYFKNGVNNSADTIVFSGSGFQLGTTYLGKAIYLDSVWYEPKDIEYAQSDISDGSEIAKAPADRRGNTVNSKLISNSKYTVDYTCTTNTRDGGDGAFTMITIPNTVKEGNFNLIGELTSKDNISENTAVVESKYKWLNMWVWSPAPQTGGFGIIPITAGSFNLDVSKRAVRSVDWSGWKLVSFDISDLTDIKSINVNFNGFVNNEMPSGFIYSQDSNGNYVQTVDSRYDTTRCFVGPWQRWTNGGYIGFENIWLSETKPEAPEQTIPQTANVIEPLEGDTVLVDANKPPVQGYTETADNSRIYGKAYRSNAVESTYIPASTGTVKVNYMGADKGMLFAKTPETYKDGTYSTTYTDGIKSQRYLNFWMYLPAPQYDQFGNYSEYNLCITRMLSSGTNNKAFGIIANWSGWKLISVYLPSGSVGLADHLGDIYIGANGYRNNTDAGWGNGSTFASANYGNYTYDLKNPKTGDESKIDLEASVDYRGNLYNTFYDVANAGRFYIERVWLSDDKPSASFTGDIALAEEQQTVNRDVTAREVKFVSGTDIAYAGDTACGADLIVKTVASEDKKSISGSFADDLELSRAYTVALPTLTDAAGNKYTGQNVWQLNTQGLHAYIDSDGSKITVKVSEAVHELHPTATLICAFFDENGTTLENVELAYYDSETGGYKIDYNKYKASKTAKYMMWTDTMRPLIVSKSLY